jgi:DNA-binding MarR family transcriptional regulator/GNAT superfamily N-acetyltransferase
MTSSTITEAGTSDPTAAQVAQVRAFNRFYTNVIGVLHGMYLDSPYTLTEGRLLFEIANHGSVEVSWLRRALDIDAGYLSRVLTRFEAESLVTRHRSATDARRQEIRVTDAGRAAAAELDSRSAGQIAMLLQGADCTRLLNAMQIITSELGRPKEDSTAAPNTTAPNTAAPNTAASESTASSTTAPYTTARDTTAPNTTARETTAPERIAPRVVTLRPSAPGDLGWVLQRHATVYATEFGWDASFESLCARIIAEYTALRDAHPVRTAGWIAEVDGVPAGSVYCVPDSDTTARLRLLLVEQWARGLGLGAKLVAQCLRFARDSGYDDITLWTYDRLAAARNVYKAAGFTLAAEHPEDAFGHHMMSQTWSHPL